MHTQRQFPWQPSAVVSCISFVVLVATTWESGFTVPSDSSTWWKLLGVGGCAAGGQLAMTKAFAAGPPTRVAVVALSQVVIAMLYDVVFWGRQFEPITFVGILLIVAPTAWNMLGDAASKSVRRPAKKTA